MRRWSDRQNRTMRRPGRPILDPDDAYTTRSGRNDRRGLRVNTGPDLVIVFIDITSGMRLRVIDVERGDDMHMSPVHLMFVMVNMHAESM